MLSIAHLECVRGDRRLFSELSFTLDHGSLLHVHGANGSGKTTLLRAIAGLVLPSAGEIQWDGVPTRKLGEDFNHELIYIGHHDGLKFELSAYENLRILARLSGFDISEQEVEAALRHMGLGRCFELPVKLLSQGQKKRVALTRLLLQRARLWILDEPFVALDVAGVDTLLTLIKKHVAAGGMLILTTHQAIEVDAGELQHLHLDKQGLT